MVNSRARTRAQCLVLGRQGRARSFSVSLGAVFAAGGARIQFLLPGGDLLGRQSEHLASAVWDRSFRRLCRGSANSDSSGNLNLVHYEFLSSVTSF